MLKVEHITKYYGDFLAVDDLSFEIKDGEIFGLLGVNGAGKTTTFRMILGLLDKNAGTVLLNGKPIDYSVTDKIGFVTEERSLLLKMTVKEQALFYGALKGMDEEAILKRLDSLLKKFNISEYLNRKMKELSKGNQQKIQFIMAILNEPRLLILDEPFSGLDPINTELFKDVIREYKKDGCMIIFSSHQLEHVEQFCEKLVILVNGKSVLSGDLKKIKEDYRRKNIKIMGDIDKNKLAKIKGVIKVTKDNLEYLVSIENADVVNKVFKYISTCANITKFEVEEPSLNEIFINVVGESYEKKD